jgi:uncharacterized repeat protein (TIGR01451 family)
MNRNRTIGIALLAGALLMTSFASKALALTPACTSINNRATLSYAVSGVTQDVIESSPGGNSTSGAGNGADTTFTVAAKVDLTVTNTHAGSMVTATGANNVMTFRIDNLGNETQRYMLQLYAANTGSTFRAGSDDFNMNNVKVYTDLDDNFGNGTSATIASPAATNGSDLGLTADVAATGSIYVHVVADVPAGRSTGEDAIYTLKARTFQTAAVGHKGTDGNDGTEAGATGVDGDLSSTVCGTEVVLADGDADDQDVDGDTNPDPGPGASDDGADGDYYASGYYRVATAAISVRKTQTVLWDPVNGDSSPKAIPGAYVTYTLTISNTGSVSATLTEISDDLAAELDLDPDWFTGADLDPSDGPYALAAGKAVKVESGTHPTRYFSADDTDTDDDGVAYSGNPGGLLKVIFSPTPPAAGTALPADPGYAIGELKAGESVSISFNVIIK